MLTIAPWRDQADARSVARSQSTTWWLLFIAWIGFAFVFAGIAYSTTPRNMALAMCPMLLGLVATFVRPRVGVYLIAAFGGLGDQLTASWYPFVKNLSTEESVLFLSPSLPVSPAELYLLCTALAWLLHMSGSRQWRLERGTAFWPVLAFGGFVLLAFGRAFATGGDIRVAQFQARPLLAFVGLYVLSTNLLTTRRQWKIVIVLLMMAQVVNSFWSIGYLRGLGAFERSQLETVVEHASAVHMNLLFVLLFASWIYRGGSRAFRYLLPFAAIPVGYIYLMSQRRAAFVGLVAAIVMAAIVVFWYQRKLFWRVVPVVGLLAALYVGAFWNVEAGPGFPAQAVKSVIAPDQLSEKDQSSDVYRTIENIDLLATIHSEPLLGIGYGQPFFRPIALPDISAFEFHEYIPHNSVLATWMNLGLPGLLSLLAVFAVGLRTGGRVIQRTLRGQDGAIAFSATAFVLMYAVFAYVDIAWDARSGMYLALCLALLSTMYRTMPPEEPAATGHAS